MNDSELKISWFWAIVLVLAFGTALWIAFPYI